MISDEIFNTPLSSDLSSECTTGHGLNTTQRVFLLLPFSSHWIMICIQDSLVDVTNVFHTYRFCCLGPSFCSGGSVCSTFSIAIIGAHSLTLEPESLLSSNTSVSSSSLLDSDILNVLTWKIIVQLSLSWDPCLHCLQVEPQGILDNASVCPWCFPGRCSILNVYDHLVLSFYAFKLVTHDQSLKRILVKVNNAWTAFLFW